jgi:uncharacterized protein GlcG (DUF336 family)/NAD-dependent dihydropyrimidine dehydrogenase PreA subunit
MTYIIAQPCEDLKDATCVQVCPVDCIHTTAESRQYYIDPEVCIECEQCALVCPVHAVYLDKELPEEWHRYIETDRAFFRGKKEGIMAVPVESAIEMIKAAHKKAGELNINVSVSIVDEAGRLIAMGKMDRALAMGVEFATNKAYTAAQFQLSTQLVAGMANQSALFINSVLVSSQGKMMPVGGGVPIVKDGVSVVGAIGVAGGTPDQDEECCRAAIAAVPV